MRGIWRKRDKMKGMLVRKGDKKEKVKSVKKALSCLTVIWILVPTHSKAKRRTMFYASVWKNI